MVFTARGDAVEMRYQTLFIYDKEIRVTNGIISSIVTEAKGKDIVEKAQVFEEGRQRHAREAGFSFSNGQLERSLAGVYGRGVGIRTFKDSSVVA